MGELGGHSEGVVGLILAGGSGSRLLPFTKYTHKTLLPLYDRPVIDYALATMRRAGINNITIVANRHIMQISDYIGSGVGGERFHYVLEESPRGVAGALNLARSRVDGKRMLLYFSDNITSWNFAEDVEAFNASEGAPGAVLLVRKVDDPGSFGVCIMDEEGTIVDIVEKPKNSKSDLAVGGIYLFDETFYERFDAVGDSDKFSISDITRQYTNEGIASIRDMGETTWIDCGTPQNLLEASILAINGEINADFKD
jgi:glucose-1-phosphate thymidylyltransferase